VAGPIHFLCHATQHPQGTTHTNSAMTKRVRIIHRFAMEPDNCGLAVKIDLQENSPTSTCHCSWLLWAARLVTHRRNAEENIHGISSGVCQLEHPHPGRWPAHRQPRRQSPSARRLLPLTDLVRPISLSGYHLCTRYKIQYFSLALRSLRFI
jgi:hypothetical protein